MAKVRKGVTRSQYSQFIQHVTAKLGLSFLEGFLGVFSADFAKNIRAHYERNGTQNLEFTFTDITRDHVDANLFIAQLGRERVITFRLYIVGNDWFCLYCCKVIMSSFKNSNMQHTKIAVVTGSSSGIGFEASVLLARNGFYTYATMRNVGKSYKIVDVAKRDNLPLEVLQLDVSNDKSVKDAINMIAEKQGRIDVVVNNAGYGSTGAVEDFSIDEIKEQFETNFFGAIRVIQSVLPLMRKQRNGTIVNISSIGGRIAFPFSPSYASTKFAIEGLSEALEYEVAQFGIRVILVEPGIIKTNFFENIKRARMAEDPSSPYSQLLQKRIDRVKRMFENGTAAEEVAKVILRAATSYKEERNLRYIIGSDAALLTEKRKSMTDGEFFNFMSKNILDSTYN